MATPIKQDNKATAASLLAEASEAAHVKLAATLTRAKASGTAVLTKTWGEGADNASVSLASRAAAVMGGAPKPRGGAADRINKVITRIGDAAAVAAADNDAESMASALSPKSFYSAARAVLDEAKQAQADYRKSQKDDRAAAKAVLNDRTAAKADRIAALELMSEIDAAPAKAKADAIVERLRAALMAARDAGFTFTQIDSVLFDVFPQNVETVETVETVENVETVAA